jgi:hypothetical protein
MAKARKSLAVRHGRLVLTADQAATLAEIAVLVSYSDGFTYTREMMALNRRLACLAGPNYRRACLAEAATRERAYVIG